MQRTTWILAALMLLAGLLHSQEKGKRGYGAKQAKQGVKTRYLGRNIDFGHYHALLIAVEKYDRGDWKGLNGPAEDVDNLRDLLENDYGFKGHVKSLKDPKSEDIKKALESYGALGPNDNLLVWYAGHGANGADEEKTHDGYWVPAEATHNDEYVTFGQIKKRLRGIRGRVLLVSDSCYSGGLVAGHDRADHRQTEVHEIAKRESFQILTSGLKEVGDVYSGGLSPLMSAFRKSLIRLQATAVSERKAFKSISEIFVEIRASEVVKRQLPDIAHLDKHLPGVKNEDRINAESGEFHFVLKRYAMSAEEIGVVANRRLLKYAEAKDTLPGGTPYYIRAGSPDQAPMVLVRGTPGHDWDNFMGSFLMDIDEVTVERFRRFVADVGDREEFRYLSLEHYRKKTQPIVGVTLDHARKYATWARKSLPTTREWYYAAAYVPNTGKPRRYPWGEALPGKRPRWMLFPPPVSKLDAEVADVSYWGVRRLATGVREWCLSPERTRRPGFLCGGTQVRSPKDRGEFVPEKMLLCTWKEETRLIHSTSHTVGFRCIKRLH